MVINRGKIKRNTVKDVMFVLNINMFSCTYNILGGCIKKKHKHAEQNIFQDS